jgi:hypothetical protein
MEAVFRIGFAILAAAMLLAGTALMVGAISPPPF